MKFPTKYTLAIQILCICHLYKDQKITSGFIAQHTGADSSIIRYTMLDLKKKNYIASKPGPGGTVLSTDLSKVSLYDVYELVADANDSVLKFYDLPDSSNELDFATNHATNEIFNTIKNDVFAELKKTSVMDICNQINQKAYAD